MGTRQTVRLGEFGISAPVQFSTIQLVASSLLMFFERAAVSQKSGSLHHGGDPMRQTNFFHAASDEVTITTVPSLHGT